ncbi:MAG TPA: hypothetical protein PLA03_13380 [Acidobacteriota bacterium]|nr:hypothetical protein [Acidobacteriota bacterium]
MPKPKTGKKTPPTKPTKLALFGKALGFKTFTGFAKFCKCHKAVVKSPWEGAQYFRRRGVYYISQPRVESAWRMTKGLQIRNEELGNPIDPSELTIERVFCSEYAWDKISTLNLGRMEE